MKKILFLLLALPSVLAAQNSLRETLHISPTDTQATVVVLHHQAFEMISQLEGDTLLPQYVLDIAKNIEKVEMIYGFSPKLQTELTQNISQEKHWAEWASVQQNGQNIMLFAKKENESITQILVVGGDQTTAMAALLQGELTAANVQEILKLLQYANF